LKETQFRGFKRLCLTTLVFLYFLIFVGGFVRSSGSGMGCPDWPTCFGKWIPPTDISQLPTDYKEKYSQKRDKKNKEFASFLSLIGLSKIGDKILNDKSILTEAEFNPVNTWTEYVNRLVGVAVGLMMIAIFISAWKIRKKEKKIFFASVLALVSVIFQGWFGSIVVSTKLTTWVVSIHLWLAILIVMIILWLIVRLGDKYYEFESNTKRWLLVAMLVMLVQITLGIEVREKIDSFAQVVLRENWIEMVGSKFSIHRSFAWVALMVQSVIFYKLRKKSDLNLVSLLSLMTVLASIVTGGIMAYFNVPFLIQPLHILLAIMTFAFNFQCYLLITPVKIISTKIW